MTSAADPAQLVGVVVPSYNCGQFLGDALESLLAQTHRDWFAVVVDDGSTDASAAIAEHYAALDPRIRVIRQPNLGTPIARNVGIAACPTGTEYLAFLDADDVWLPDALEVLVEHLRHRPDAVGSYGLAEYMTSAGRPLRLGEHPARQRDRRRMGRFDLAALAPEQPYDFGSLVVSGTLWPSGVALHRRAVVEQVGGFDPELRQVQDWDLYVRMSRIGSFLPVDRQVIWYRQHGANVTSRSQKNAYYSQSVRYKTWRSDENTPAQRAEAQRVWRRLAGRWVLRFAEGALSALVHRRVPEARAALLGAVRFSRSAIVGHPPPPDHATAQLVADFVAAPPIATE